MAVDAIKIVVSEIFVKGGINQDFHGREEDHEHEVKGVSERYAATKRADGDMSKDDQEGEETSVVERLHCLGQAHLDLVAVLEQQLRDGAEVLERDVHDCLEVTRLTPGFQVGAQLRFVEHELVLGTRDDSSHVLAFSQELLDHLDEFLLLQRRNL